MREDGFGEDFGAAYFIRTFGWCLVAGFLTTVADKGFIAYLPGCLTIWILSLIAVVIGVGRVYIVITTKNKIALAIMVMILGLAVGRLLVAPPAYFWDFLY